MHAGTFLFAKRHDCARSEQLPTLVSGRAQYMRSGSVQFRSVPQISDTLLFQHVTVTACRCMKLLFIPTDFPNPRTSPATTQVKTATELIQSPGTSGALEFTIWTQWEFNVFLMSGEEEKEDVLVHIEGDYYYQILILASKKFGEPWTWPELAGFTLERGTLTLRVEIGESAFSISGNGINLATYEYKEGLRPPVEKIAYYGEPGELKVITTYF